MHGYTDTQTRAQADHYKSSTYRRGPNESGTFLYTANGVLP